MTLTDQSRRINTPASEPMRTQPQSADLRRRITTQRLVLTYLHELRRDAPTGRAVRSIKFSERPTEVG